MKGKLNPDSPGNWMDTVRYYWPTADDEQCKHILWELTCFPMSTEYALQQLYELYISFPEEIPTRLAVDRKDV